MQLDCKYYITYSCLSNKIEYAIFWNWQSKILGLLPCSRKRKRKEWYAISYSEICFLSPFILPFAAGKSVGRIPADWSSLPVGTTRSWTHLDSKAHSQSSQTPCRRSNKWGALYALRKMLTMNRFSQLINR